MKAEAYSVLHYICPDCETSNTMATSITNAVGNPIGNCRKCRKLWSSGDLVNHYSTKYGFHEFLNLPPTNLDFNLFPYEFVCECGEVNVVFPDAVASQTEEYPESPGYVKHTQDAFFGLDKMPKKAVCKSCQQESELDYPMPEQHEKFKH